MGWRFGDTYMKIQPNYTQFYVKCTLPYTGISLRVIVNNTIILLVIVDPDDIHVFLSQSRAAG